MKVLLFALSLSVLLKLCSFVNLPPAFQKCNKNSKDFKVCLTQAAENAISQMNKPFPKVGLPSLEPLKIQFLEIDPGKTAVSFGQNYRNLEIYGFTNVSCSECDYNEAKNSIRLNCTVPEIYMKFDYNISGRILLLPIVGHGKGTMRLYDVNTITTYHLSEYEKRLVKYYKIVETTLEMTPKSIKFDLENLFEGNKPVGDMVLSVLNENWMHVYDDVRSRYEDAFAQIFSSIFNNFLSRVPVDDIFSKD